MVTSSAVRESSEAALVRLAVKAKQDGIKLYRGLRDGRHYASSRSQLGTLHYVTGISCTCAAFFAHQRRSHLAALHSALGWLEPERPEPPAPTRCPACNGTGAECGGVSTGRSWTYASVTCGPATAPATSQPDDQRGRVSCPPHSPWRPRLEADTNTKR